MNSYSEPGSAASYIAFMGSEEGQTQQRLIWEAASPRIQAAQGSAVLDAACGTGWFAGRLAELNAAHPHEPQVKIFACDASAPLVEHARATYPSVHFDVVDLSGKDTSLPYAPESFSTVVLNMALHDFADVPAVLANVRSLLAPSCKLLVTIANPYYSFPVGTWKRGWLDRLLNRKPHLVLENYGALARKTDRTFKWHSSNTSYFYTLPEILSELVLAGFTLTHAQDLLEKNDSPKFGRQYKMYRYPLIVLLELSKASG